MLITGISGQDGQFLSEYLIGKGYRVFGIINGQSPDNSMHLKETFPQIDLLSADLTDSTSLIRAIEISKPDEIYNLAAISFVGMSFAQPEHTANVTGLGALRLLEAVRICGIQESVKIYQASSSEMFGKVQQTPQNEKTPFYPRSPY